MADYDKRHASLEYKQNNEYEIVLSAVPEKMFSYGLIILTQSDLNRGYNYCINHINGYFTRQGININDRIASETRHVIYKYFDEISLLGFNDP